MEIERDGSARTPLWRDPMSMSFQAHRRVLMMRLRWHDRNRVGPTGRLRRHRRGLRRA